MLIKILLALFLPFLLVVLFTRVTYNYYVGTLLTITLIIASIFKGYTDSILVGVVDAISIAAGFWYSRKKVKEDHT